MNEDALRALVRETLARLESERQKADPSDPVGAPPLSFAPHSSHYRYAALPSSGGPCLIEPNVRCNHCGYCESHGH
ncbi:MAG TPA: hypothetical protein VL484_01455 [Vicinamibacterales bacterium]|jgi:hypothetical protein|nr:hypothetical protein [Vicinamibacterales bacterium]